MTRRPTFHRALALTAAGLLGLGGLAACGGDDSKADDGDVIAPEDVKVPMSEVLAGLPEIVEHGNKAASAGATGDYTTAKSEFAELHEGWEAIEGTIKDTDVDVYERMETAQGLIKDGAEHSNAERIQQGADDQSDAAADFISAHSTDTTGATDTTVAGGGDTSTTSTTVGGAGDNYATDEGDTP